MWTGRKTESAWSSQFSLHDIIVVILSGILRNCTFWSCPMNRIRVSQRMVTESARDYRENVRKLTQVELDTDSDATESASLPFCLAGHRRRHFLRLTFRFSGFELAKGGFFQARMCGGEWETANPTSIMNAAQGECVKRRFVCLFSQLVTELKGRGPQTDRAGIASEVC